MAASAPLPRDAWRDGLREAAREDVVQRALEPAADAGPRIEVHGRAFVAFAEAELPVLLDGREALVVWTGDDDALAAADALLEPDAPDLLAVRPEVLDAWLAEHPDDTHAFHLVFASHTQEVTPERLVLRTAVIWGADDAVERVMGFTWQGGHFEPEPDAVTVLS